MLLFRLFHPKYARLRGLLLFVVGALIWGAVVDYVLGEIRSGAQAFSIPYLVLIAPVALVSLGLVWLVGGEAGTSNLFTDVKKLSAWSIVLGIVLVLVYAALLFAFEVVMRGFGYSTSTPLAAGIHSLIAMS
jgi:hypothetical protein